MIIKEIKKEVKEVDVVTDTSYVCDKCGKKESESENVFAVNLYHNLKTQFCYGSEFDGEIWEADVCDQCMIDFFKSFKHEPKKKNYPLI